MARPDRTIRTERLVLRPFETTDLDDVFAYRRLPEVNRYLYSEPYTREQTEENLAKWTARDQLTEEGQSLALAVTLNGQVIGEADLKWLSREHRQGEVGYIFNPAFHGRGYASEAARAILALGFDHFGLHRIRAECEARNVPSWRVMERLGMRREAHLREFQIFKGEWADSYVYAMLAREYRTTR
ncbi:Protein N-acetyltransferase, RimJ/RimL family [Lentzea xinjiangensis]|uniref:Protein N-acetyltransferase, RimJ/RimL family n=1 Tax=Lentzea xinjiangensis TaxID=402600 RepID=A0A1H9DYB4_9PSEU|nr:GNAT family N-acetyltransferase [Lentzea xinjiangensis]SEQ18461.1 Protein N-acetyltransferase, RimJ/RimL family [Lentzea xinjiangensis]